MISSIISIISDNVNIINTNIMISYHIILTIIFVLWIQGMEIHDFLSIWSLLEPQLTIFVGPPGRVVNDWDKLAVGHA